MTGELVHICSRLVSLLRHVSNGSVLVSRIDIVDVFLLSNLMFPNRAFCIFFVK